jgi:hypothetical protein
MARVLLLTLMLASLQATPAFAECSPRELLCADEVSIAPADARAFLESELGQALPPDLAVVSFLEGGFQDLFIEVEFAGSPKSIATMLQLLQIDPNAMIKDDPAAFGLSSDPIWTLTADTPIISAEGLLGSFATVRAALPVTQGDDGQHRLFLLAFKI